MTPCVQAILCGLAAPLRAAVVAAAQGAIIALELQAAKLRVALGVLNIATVPLQFTATILQAQLDIIESVANVLPTGITAGCPEIGLSIDGFNLQIEGARAEVDREIAKINRKLAFGDQLQAKIDVLEAAIADIEATVIQVAQSCVPEVA